MAKINKREFLAASIAAGLGLTGMRKAFGQQGSAGPSSVVGGQSAGNGRTPSRKAKTMKLFKSPPGFPNAIAVTPEGLWIAEQKLSGQQAIQYRLPEPNDLTENAWLGDWNGKVLKKVATSSKHNTRIAEGGDRVFM